MSKRKSKKTNKLTDEQINKIGEKMGRENFLEGEGGDLGRAEPIRKVIASDSAKVYTLRSALGYVFAFQHPQVMLGKNIPIHCSKLAGALKIDGIGEALRFQAHLKVNIGVEYVVEELEMELRSYSISHTSLSLAK